jgi:hypothetical protein
MEELIKRYDELYEDMASSKDPKKMMVFGGAEKWIFRSVAEKHPEIAEKWLTILEAGRWNNYVSKSEAEECAAKLVNQDGSVGAHWPYEAFKAAVESLGAKMSDEPYYNCWALWLVANMRYSDNYKSASEFVPKDMMPKFFYMMAVENLKDADRPRFVRDYFKLE